MSLQIRGATRGTGSGVGYESLFKVGVGRRLNDAPSGHRWNANSPGNDFARRFGLARAYERNANLIKVLEKPKQALEEVNQAIYKMSTDSSMKYQGYLNDLRNLGFSDAEAVDRADLMVGREMENDLFLLSQKAPYAVGGAAAGGWDPVQAVLNQNPEIRALPRTFAAIGSSGGLNTGLGPVKRITKRKAIKRRLRAKYKPAG